MFSHSIRQTLPEPAAHAGPSWFEHAVDYTAYKWPRVAATNRSSIAWVIAEVTVALLPHRLDDRDLWCEPTLRDCLGGDDLDGVFERDGQRLQVGDASFKGA